MAQEVLKKVANADVARIVAEYQAIHWACVVTADGDSTSTITATSGSSDNARSATEAATMHAVSAKELAAMASAHAALANVHLQQ